MNDYYSGNEGAASGYPDDGGMCSYPDNSQNSSSGAGVNHMPEDESCSGSSTNDSFLYPDPSTDNMSMADGSNSSSSTSSAGTSGSNDTCSFYDYDIPVDDHSGDGSDGAMSIDDSGADQGDAVSSSDNYYSGVCESGEANSSNYYGMSESIDDPIEPHVVLGWDGEEVLSSEPPPEIDVIAIGSDGAQDGARLFINIDQTGIFYWQTLGATNVELDGVDVDLNGAFSVPYIPRHIQATVDYEIVAWNGSLNNSVRALITAVMEELPVQGIDDFAYAKYDLDYKSENGDLSKILVVHYRDNTSREMNIDSISESTPNLWKAKKDVLHIMDEYNTMFILNTVPVLWFLLTLVAGEAAAMPGAPGARSSYTISRQAFNKVGHPKSDLAQGMVKKIQQNGDEVIVNIGGAGAKHEPPGAINVNNQAVGRKNIPNLVEADGSQIGQIFSPGTVDKIVSHRMAPGVIDWSSAAPGAFRILKPGGKFMYSYRGANSDAQVGATALRNAGFKEVTVIQDVVITAVKPGG